MNGVIIFYLTTVVSSVILVVLPIAGYVSWMAPVAGIVFGVCCFIFGHIRGYSVAMKHTENLS